MLNIYQELHSALLCVLCLHRFPVNYSKIAPECFKLIFSCFPWESKACLKLFVPKRKGSRCWFDQILKHICSITQTYTVGVYIQVYYVRGPSDVEYFIEVGWSVFSYSDNLNWMQNLVVSVARLGIWDGAGVCGVPEPRFLTMKGLPLRAQRKLTRQAWVCQWQAPGRKLVWVHGRLSSCSCMTLTTATTRQAILLLLVLSEAVFLWYDARGTFRGMQKEGSGFMFEFVSVAACSHACISVQRCKDMCMHVCMTACVCVSRLKTLILH